MPKSLLPLAVLLVLASGFSGAARANELTDDFTAQDFDADSAASSDLLAEPVSPAFCDRTAAEIQASAFDPSSRIEIYNHGGLLGGGVCWWHSRLQRSALFLATYRPDLAKPSHRQGVAIINTLAGMNHVVTIPGYASFYDFSRDYENEIIARLEAWQRFDGFLGFRWIDGLMGHWHVAPRTLQYIMTRIHQMVTVEHRLIFEKLHFNSIASHAYLIIGSHRTEKGYNIDVIDSNHPSETLSVTYEYGQTSLYKPDDGQAFVPYLDYDGDNVRIFNTIARACAGGTRLASELR